jgi:16S rRNA (uracil1498-N3)-methyltransferase
LNRLHLPPRELKGPATIVRDEALAYLREVLRLRPGAAIEVFDGEGAVYPSVLERYVEDGALLKLGAREDRPFQGAPITLLQGLPKADKLELIVQKAVELGARRLVPVSTERSIVRLDDRKAADRVARWQKIADEAARQSGRADLMTIDAVSSLDQILAQSAAPSEKRFVLDEEERTTRLRDVLTPGASGYSFLIGPEGGLTREEVGAARAAGFTAVTLGRRVLRTETVALTVLSIVQYALGDLG